MSERTDSLWRHPDFRRLWAGQTASFLGSEVSHLAPTDADRTVCYRIYPGWS